LRQIDGSAENFGLHGNEENFRNLECSFHATMRMYMKATLISNNSDWHLAIYTAFTSFHSVNKGWESDVVADCEVCLRCINDTLCCIKSPSMRRSRWPTGSHRPRTCNVFDCKLMSVNMRAASKRYELSTVGQLVNTD
jgi:hypothetical protein